VDESAKPVAPAQPSARQRLRWRGWLTGWRRFRERRPLGEGAMRFVLVVVRRPTGAVVVELHQQVARLLSHPAHVGVGRDSRQVDAPGCQFERPLPRLAWQHSAERRQQRPISRRQRMSGDLPLERSQLMPRQQDLDLLLPLPSENAATRAAGVVTPTTTRTRGPRSENDPPPPLTLPINQLRVLGTHRFSFLRLSCQPGMYSVNEKPSCW
jgi:hypothetical protein